MLDFIGMKALLVILILAVIVLGGLLLGLLNMILANAQQEVTNSFVISEQLRKLKNDFDSRTS